MKFHMTFFTEMEVEIFFKIHIETQKLKTYKAILSKNNPVGGISIPDFKLF